MLKTVAENKNFSHAITILWGITVVLLLYNTYLSIKVNKAQIKELE